MIIGIISDTHGSISADALAAMQGVQQILHAGDVGGGNVIDALEAIAPVTAVLGNTDSGGWARRLRTTALVDLDGQWFYVLHDLYRLDLDPVSAGIQVVISGHTHQAAVTRENGVLYFNPGSASHGRHGYPPSVGRITISPLGLHPEVIQL